MMTKYFTVLYLCFLQLICCSNISAEISSDNKVDALTAPDLTNNPSWDIIATSNRPLFSFFNASGGIGERTYILQIDKVPTFDSKDLIEYKNIPETNKYVTERRCISDKLTNSEHQLTDKTRYYWRVRAVDSQGNQGPWGHSRFFLDIESNKTFMNMVRIHVANIEVSSGQNPKNIMDLDDPGQETFWQAAPSETAQWIKFDFGKEQEVARMWLLSNIESSPEGWLKNFVLQQSDDGKTWNDIPGTSFNDNDTFRNIINFTPTKIRYLRLLINDWHGYAAQVNAVTLYAPGKPPIPKTPDSDYVVLIGNQENGYTFSQLAQFIENLDLGLKTLTIPHYKASLEMINNLNHKPVAIVLSGNNANYPNLPMFEYNGEYEIIRESDIPIIGICCGIQQLAMAYGYTYARSLGWEDISSLESRQDLTKIDIIKQDPIFDGIPNPFTAVEIHGWAVAILPKDYEIIAESSYIQGIKNKSKMIYGEQFHAEIPAPYNEGTPYLVNFLKMAKTIYTQENSNIKN